MFPPGGFSGLVNEKLTPRMKKTWGTARLSHAAPLPRSRSCGPIGPTVSFTGLENDLLDLSSVCITS